MQLSDYKVWLATAVCRNPACSFVAVSIQTDTNGNPSAIVGTISTPAIPAVAAVPPSAGNQTGTPGIPAVPAQTNVAMSWNMNGTAMNRDRGLDLVQSVPLSSITVPTT